MPLSPGDRLGPYEILSLIGVGGMGEVYKARDTRLDRLVALKVSKAEFTERFKQEASLVAQLNHKNICTLYDVGPNFLVMELIDGVPLKGPLPVEKAVEYAGQILDALDHAHSKAITHRDLKPANVMVTKEGIKLLDFGLAKKSTPPKHDDVTRAALTMDGQITGTLQYMAPEQLQGKDADARSDLFSFGCVLYEMLSGTRAFDGSSAASVIAAVLERQPEPLKTPPPLDRVIRRCLAKDPGERFQTALDLKYNLGLAIEAPDVVGDAANSRVRLLSAAAAAGILIAAAAILYAFRATNVPAPETRLDIVTPPTNNPASFALSPDGRKIAFVATSDGSQRLWVRSLDSTSAQPLPGTEGALSPFWSPDGRSLGFFADFKLKRVDLGGGAPQSVVAVSTPVVAQGAWSDEGVILYATNTSGPLFRVPASGGQAVPATILRNGQSAHRTPRFLPGGRQFLFYATGADSAIWLGSLDGGEPRRIIATASGADSPAEYLAPGWLVREKANVLVAQRLDPGPGQLSGEPITLAQGVGLDQTALRGSFTVSPSGLIAWRSGGSRRQLIWFNRSGQEVGALGAPDNFNLFFPELSPDGKRVAITRGISGTSDIWMQDGTRASRFTFGPADNMFEIWSPEGARVVFDSSRKGVYDFYQKPANGSGSEEVLLQSTENKYPNSWSSDGRFILYSSAQNNGDLMVLPVSSTEKPGDRKPFPFLSTPFSEMLGAFSPDSKWVAYQSNESGRFEIYVRPFPGPGGQWQISTGGGTSPRWRADGKELYYLTPDNKLMAAVVVTQGATFNPGTPEALFQTHIQQSVQRQNYDVARDGRFLIDTELQDTNEPIHLLLNWHPPAK